MKAEKERLRLTCNTGLPEDIKLLRENGEDLLDILPVSEIGFSLDTKGYTLHLIMDTINMEVDFFLERGRCTHRVIKRRHETDSPIP